MIYLIIAVCICLYWIGGQEWAHTLFRDLGCSLCILAVAVLTLGFSWTLLLIVPIAWGGMTIGDHEEWKWSIHAFVISLGMLPYSIINGTYVSFIIMSAMVTGGTYLTSKFLSNKFGIDVIARGLLYGMIPLFFLIRS